MSALEASRDAVRANGTLVDDASVEAVVQETFGENCDCGGEVAFGDCSAMAESMS